MGLVQNNVLGMANVKRNILEKNTLSFQLSKTFKNIGVKQHKKHHLTLREEFTIF